MDGWTKWLWGAAALGAAALLGNLAPRLYRSNDVVAKELAEQRALLTAMAKRLDARPLSPMPRAPGSTTIIGAACDPATLSAQVEASVRDALAADRKDLAEEAKDVGVAPNNAEIYAKAESWIDAKLETKRWAPSDFAELARASIGLSDEQRRELKHRVLIAVNSGDFDASRPE